jgi:hypothetical protein
MSHDARVNARLQVDRRLVVILAALIASVIGIAAGFAVAVHVDDTAPVGGGPAMPGPKGVVSGTLVLVGPAPAGTAPVMMPVVGQVAVASIYQYGPVAYNATVGSDGTFSVPVYPGRYTVSGVSPLYLGGRQSCRVPHTVRVAAGQHVNVIVECQSG